jgi:hypothetical protein
MAYDRVIPLVEQISDMVEDSLRSWEQLSLLSAPVVETVPVPDKQPKGRKKKNEKGR